MDLKVFAAVLAVSLLVFAGIAFAMPGWNRMFGGGGIGVQNGTDGMPIVHRMQNWNGSAPGCVGWNGTDNITAQFNEFSAAVQNGNYDAAKQLHESYGFGGPLFEKLNETTFAKYSQIQKLKGELRTELGMNPGGPQLGGFARGVRAGSGFGFGRGMHKFRANSAADDVDMPAIPEQ
jgi:hypothetical protein